MFCGDVWIELAMVHVLWQQEVMCGASHGACFVAAGSGMWS